MTLHTRNCWFLTKIWKPFRHIMRPILRNFDIQTSLIDSFATLFLLSSIKFQSVSSDLLLPTRLYDINGRPNSKTYLYLAGDVEYFGSKHLPFAIIALLVFSMFVILPTLLLFLYPCRCFQQLLNRLHCNFHVLRVFMDVFLGPYKDGTDNSRDLRYFAGAFFLARIIFVLLFGYLDFFLSVALNGLVFSILLLMTAIFQPQKVSLHCRLCFFVFCCCDTSDYAWRGFRQSYYCSYLCYHYVCCYDRIAVTIYVYYWSDSSQDSSRKNRFARYTQECG